MVESQPSKLLVAGSIPVSRSMFFRADVAQLAERVLGKDEVTGSIPVIGSRQENFDGRSSGRVSTTRGVTPRHNSEDGEQWRRRSSIGQSRT